MTLSAVLLAAGPGRRLGYPKAALRLRGIWMLPRLVRALRGGGAQFVAVVLSREAQEQVATLGPTGADRDVVNPCPEAGRTGSVLCGLAALPPSPEGVLVHPCDVPLLRPAAVAAVVAAWRAAAEPAATAARPVTPSGRGGHPLLLGSARLEELRGFPPDRSLRDLLQADPKRVLNVRLEGDPGPFLDVDTPEQLALLESLLGPAPASP